jgi:F0F1-type ATP synthase assembly protein I
VNSFLRYADLAFEIAGFIIAPPLVGLFLGEWIDGRFKTAPVFTLVLIFLGIIAGIRSLARLAGRTFSGKTGL